MMQTWEHKQLNPEFQMIVDTWKKHNLCYEFVLMDALDREQFIQKHFESSVIHAYQQIIPGAYKSDLFRYCYLWVNGGVYATGNVVAYSDARRKKDVVTIDNALDKVLQLRGVTYVKKENNVKEMGVIAEEIAEILPDVVLYDSEGKVDSVSYGRITAVLIEAIKDLKKEIEELKSNK